MKDTPKDIPMLSEIVDSADEYKMLKALRMKLAVTLDRTTSARDISSLCKQLREINEKIKMIEESNQDSLIEEIILKKRMEGRAVRVGSKRVDYTE